MGWTSTDARFYTADGKVNRKAECDALYTWEGEKTKNEVIKSSMRGSLYYAAVRTTDKTTGHSEVFAAVCLTSTRRDGGFNFGYKGMAEDMGPCEDDCPKGILVLLTDTESKYAKEWRERCWAKIRDKKQNRQSLASIKIGEIIEFERGGVTIRAEKMAPAYQFKTPWFKVVGEFEYVHKTEIKDWRIVADNAATPAETPQISTETAETVNVSVEGKKKAERAKYRFTHNEIEEMKRQILGECEFNATALEEGCKKVFPEMGEYSALNIRRGYEAYINELKEGSKNRKFCERRLALYESLTENDRPNFIQQTPPEPIKNSEHLPEPPEFAPQSPETPQPVEYTTDTPEPREMARKRLNRAIGSAQTTRRDTLRDTLRSVTYVPRECSTADAAYW